MPGSESREGALERAAAQVKAHTMSWGDTASFTPLTDGLQMQWEPTY